MLSQILRASDLGLKVIAGARGIDTRGPVSWIHTSELPDPSKWLRGGEILLTTGFGVRRAPRAQQRLIVNLDALGCIGIGLGIGDWLKAVPAVMIEEADRRGFPLFTVPYSTPFSVVTRHVAQKIFEEQYALRQPGVDPRRHLLAQVLLAEDIPSLAEALAQRIAPAHVLVFNFFGELLARHPSRGQDVDATWHATSPHRRRDHFSLRVDERTLTGAVIRVNELAEAILIVASNRALRENELALFEQASSSMGLAIRYGISPRISRRAQFSTLLRDIADDAFVPAALAGKLAAWGIDQRRGLTALAVAARAPVSIETVAGVVEDALAQGNTVPLVGHLDERIYAIVGKEGGVARLIHDAMVRENIRQFGIGVSRTYRSALGLRHAIREAGLALPDAADGEVRRVGELGLSGLMPYLRSDKTAHEAIARVLEPVREHDRRHGSELMRTLHVYVRNAFRPGASATKLGIHRHTLTYRLQQIAHLTKRDIHKGEHLLELSFALSLMDSSGTGGLRARGASAQAK